MERNLKQLPHDLLAEKSLLGCLIMDGNSFDEMSDLKLKREDFYHPQYGVIYEAITDLNNSSQPIDLITVCSKLTELGKIEEVGGQASVMGIVEDQASAANIYHYAKVVKDKSSMREVVRTAERVAAMGYDFGGKPEDFIQEVESSFFKLTNEAKSGKMQKLNSCLKLNLKELEDTSRKPGEIHGLTTGYPKVDEMLLGLQPGQLIVLAARPAMGKTALALNFAQNACAASGLPVAIFSLEMLSNELSMRLLSQKAKVDSKRIRQKNFLDTDLRSIGKAVQELSQYPIYINDSGDSTILDIQSQCRKIKTESGIGLIIIDYLQLMSASTKNLPREQQISEMSRGLKSMAKELGCPVIALSQLNRGVEARPNKRPMTSDLRESGAIEQDADIIMFVYRDEYYNPDTKEPGIAEIIVGKNRAGETGTAKLSWVGPYTSFENPAFSTDDN
ncbi:replicative DNA helicase [Halobacteriovorax sp. HLS]|uniref:replicative DNA helicase n=1 Tax=Halobacteriovorax sp. HLS TaxID=2234000 RepID=UPI000FD9FC83|nr:replicative DNA helicase [Halobacteriovorax sp. HLS]